MADKKWYVVHVYSGFERKIAEQIKQQAAQKGLADKFDEVLVPTEQVVEVRRGQKVDTDRKFFPGYVLVKMEMTDDAWHLALIHHLPFPPTRMVVTACTQRAV